MCHSPSPSEGGRGKARKGEPFFRGGPGLQWIRYHISGEESSCQHCDLRLLFPSGGTRESDLHLFWMV